jgi:4-amino-4-deoxy-L-arabinose transferase-like glycosyltransferase
MGLFGQSIPGIRFGLLLVTAATTVLVYFLAARLFGRVAGLFAAAAHGLLAANLGAMGTYGHAMHFVALPATGALLLIAPGSVLTRTRLFFAGVLLAMAVLMKQPGIAFVLFAIVWIALEARPVMRSMGLLAAGGISVALLTAAILSAAGVFDRFWFWTIDYAREYVTQATAEEAIGALDTSLGSINYCAPMIWLAALAGLGLLFVDGEARRHWKFVIGFFAASLLATVPGFYFRPHYFLVAFPAIALLVGIAASSGMRLLARASSSRVLAAIPIVAVTLILAGSVVRQWSMWMRTDLAALTKLIYLSGPFNEAIVVSDYLRQQTTPQDRIAVVGSEPEIYFYSKRKSATGYIYTYALLELQKFALSMQDEMIQEIESARPKYLVYVNEKSSWARKDESQLKIFQWLETRANQGYRVDGYVDMIPGGSVYVWGDEARKYTPKSKDHILLLRRVEG